MQFFLVQGSLGPAPSRTLMVNGLPKDLTGKTVQFSMQLLEATTLAIDHATATVASPATSGVVSYSFTGGQTATAGHYRVRWTDSTDSIDFPTDGWDDLFILPSLPVT